MIMNDTKNIDITLNIDKMIKFLSAVQYMYLDMIVPTIDSEIGSSAVYEYNFKICVYHFSAYRALR